ncbi:MAG: hypothetical protein FWD26_03465 [Treponema sp.]|nr:hypothetical protein [Treponema sp.]
MQTLSIFELLKQVITSWQVIAITVALILFLNIVFYVARRYHRPMSMPKISFKGKKGKKAEKAAPQEEIVTHDDDLGLEEA